MVGLLEHLLACIVSSIRAEVTAQSKRKRCKLVSNHRRRSGLATETPSGRPCERFDQSGCPRMQQLEATVPAPCSAYQPWSIRVCCEILTVRVTRVLGSLLSGDGHVLQLVDTVEYDTGCDEEGPHGLDERSRVCAEAEESHLCELFVRKGEDDDVGGGDG